MFPLLLVNNILIRVRGFLDCFETNFFGSQVAYVCLSNKWTFTGSMVMDNSDGISHPTVMSNNNANQPFVNYSDKKIIIQ